MLPSLEVRQITLRVANLARSIDFYAGKLGFVAERHDAAAAELATGAGQPPILRLREDDAAATASGDQAGLFHAALLFPDRTALGGWLQFAAKRGVEFEGFSDHAVSEAIYFSDPDGNGLEFYADRARDVWPMTDGQVEMVTRRLNVPSLLAAAALRTPPLSSARWGHLHFRVTDLDRSEAFYTDTLGMAVMQRNYPGARFLAADGYHHHVGLNTWGHPTKPQSPHALGLIEATFARREIDQSIEQRDPDGIALRVIPM